MASATESTLAIDLVVALAKLGEIGLERTAAFLHQQAIATVACDQDLADATPAHSTLGTASPTPWPIDCRCRCCSWPTISAAPICGRHCERSALAIEVSPAARD